MKKLLNKKGFTLMEMLIVVAIIVILVAISIPTFSNSLESSKKATDAANFRSAKSALVMQTMNDAADKIVVADVACYYYDYEAGKFIKAASASAAATAAKDKSEGECNKHADKYIRLDKDASNNVFVEWSDDSVNCDTPAPAGP